ncbi:hypothetical protein C0Q70_10128 [Pomacea canaliculata]|uniref:WxxW domain-containing protein n=1 Tax=Pomacea canaliculata TaxID=400727 RepID=A0A2T7PBQ4_POMCA|nr:mucin-2-like [Pomacea canaliculata]PVD30853.1 hypothetical protein C0Q70_10128 [Pomacea canaliculata]
MVEVDCQTVTGIEYFSSGEVVTCDVDQGLICNNVDNEPVPCNDYKIRYRCECLQQPTAQPTGTSGESPSASPPSISGQTPSISPTAQTGGTPTPAPGRCTPGWTTWINTPSTNDGDREQLTTEQKQQLCPNGKMVEVDCQTVTGIEYFSSGEVVTCDVDQGLICNNVDNEPVPCNDYKIRYRCECIETPTTQPVTQTPAVTQPTGSTCISGWSAWINRDKPTTGDGDMEKLTDSELVQFCGVGGKITEIDCQTASGIEYFSSGEVLVCDLTQGLHARTQTTSQSTVATIKSGTDVTVARRLLRLQ